MTDFNDRLLYIEAIMTPLQELYTNATFRLLSLTWLDVLDLLLVTLAFYLLLSLLQRSRAAILLRGVLPLTGRSLDQFQRR